GLLASLPRPHRHRVRFQRARGKGVEQRRPIAYLGDAARRAGHDRRGGDQRARLEHRGQERARHRRRRRGARHLERHESRDAGAASYDVYVDTTAHPATRVVQDTTATSVTVNGLTPSTTYHWRVVAKSPACAVPASSPVFAFRTCATTACAFADDFDGQSATTWTSAGRGFARVVDGRLVIAGKRRFSVA